MTDNTIVFHEPVRPGDVLRTRQVLRSVSEPKTTKLGTGRFWVIDVEYLNQRDELVGIELHRLRLPAGGVMTSTDRRPLTARRGAGGRRAARARLRRDRDHGRARRARGRDWRPMHHDHDFAVNRNGIAGHLPEHAEPGGVVRALRHRLDRARRPARPDEVPHEGLGVPRRHDGASTGTVEQVETDDAGCGWATLAVDAHGRRRTSRPTAPCASRCPSSADDNPWDRRGDEWQPVGVGARLMDLEFTEEQEMLREMVRGVCTAYAPTRGRARARGRPDGYPRGALEAARRARPDRAPDPDRVRRLRDDDARRRGRLRGARPRARAVAALRRAR